MGSYYVDDISAPMEEALIKEFDITIVTFTSVFYSAYSYSGCFWPFFGGILADKYG